MPEAAAQTAADAPATPPPATAAEAGAAAGLPPDAAADAGGGLFDLAMLQDMIDLGGPVVVVLALLSVAGLAIAVAKLLQFRRARVWSGRDVARAVELYRAGDADGAEAQLARTPGPLARIVAVAVGARASGDRGRAREETETVAVAAVEELRGGLRVLEFIAGVSPLLGLFGTVLGMISAFRALEAAGDQVDPSILAGGIWEALFTTAAGLAVAIPALALANWFDRTVDRFAHRVEFQAGRVLTAEAPRAPRQAAAAE